MKSFRLNRLFDPVSARCFVVAIDHGIFNEPGFLQGIEFGADIIKADPTDRAEDFGKVIETAGRIPVLVRGGGKVSDAVILSRTEALIQQDARGVLYGRNIVQHTNPSAITWAQMAVVHENQPAAVAAKGWPAADCQPAATTVGLQVGNL